jgi:ATP-dependent DNA helicase DinG
LEVKTFDPDDESPYFDPIDEIPVAPLREPVVIDTGAALELLDRITHELPGGGESRQGQRDMVAAIAGAFGRREHAIIEAGTGVGKSLAYLVPSALTGERVIIATATKNLQDQLAQKDAPTVAKATSRTRVAVLKGKNSYLCRNRVEATRGDAQLSFEDGAEVPKGVADQMRRILSWAESTRTGDRDELTFEVDERAWRQLSVTPQECLHRQHCPQGDTCFHEVAKDVAAESNIVIVNAHLYASHLASGKGLLPAHDFVVFDEAHEVLDIFASLLGTSLSPTRLRAAATVARQVLGASYVDITSDLAAAADHLSAELEIQFAAEQLNGLSSEVEKEIHLANDLAMKLIEGVKAIASTSPGDDAAKIRAQGPLTQLQGDLARLLKVQRGELLYLVKREREIELELSIIDVGPILQNELWGEVTAVMTSATIPDTLPYALGLHDVPIQQFASPFDYAHNSLLYVPADMPERKDETAEAAIIEELVTLIEAAGGRTLALFTNRSVMQRVAEAVAPRLDTPVLVQGTLSRQRIVEEFRTVHESSLFAVTSFWQGIDVPGESLSLVTIDRLPFIPPNDPLMIARRERATKPFMEVDLPHAAMLLAQGVGRLIRSASDRGVVCVLDTRLATAQYKGNLFRKLPPMKRTRDRAEVVRFLQELREAND